MTGSADCSVAGGAEYFVTKVAACFGTGGTECFEAGGTEYFVAGGTDYFVGTSLISVSAYHHPNLPHALPRSCKWGNVVPMNNLP